MLEACVRRDPKGLYARALNGEIKNFKVRAVSIRQRWLPAASDSMAPVSG
ncbi:adenylyl-sulfate kinase [Mesorhizobium sp. M1406]